jgi:acid phosphatase type 7
VRIAFISQRASFPRTRGHETALGGSWGLLLGRVTGIIALGEVPRLQDLAANDEEACTLAYFHHPLFTSGVDVVLNGHDHNYQRCAPQDPGGRADPEDGIRQFVVGTGGRSHYQISYPIANTEVYNDDTYGVLELTLYPKSYAWEFVPVRRKIFSDSGVARCH